MGKSIFFFFIAFGLQITNVHAQLEFEWLVGSWKIKDKQVYEIWQHHKDGETLVGKSFRIEGADTIVTEQIALFYSDGFYHYVPTTEDNNYPVDFTITSYDDISFVAANPLHDFPKQIKYTIVRKVEGDILNAVIEGNGKVIPYVYERIR
jgi:hypothetical protein